MSAATTAVILAGQRDGVVDSLAAKAGVSHKCLAPVAGRPMIAHVVDALTATPLIREIRISVESAAVLAVVPEVARGIAAGRIRIIPSKSNLADSVLDAASGVAFPLLITTADNVMLTPSAVEAIDRDARAAHADVAVAFTRRASVLAAHPDGQRRFYRFACDSYSNCNAYWLGSHRALAAAETFRGGGQFAKHPARIASAFGLLNLIRFRFGIGTLAAAFERFSRRFGLAIRPVILADGAVAIDVDNARTRTIAEALLDMRTTRAVAAE